MHVTHTWDKHEFVLMKWHLLIELNDFFKATHLPLLLAGHKRQRDYIIGEISKEIQRP